MSVYDRAANPSNRRQLYVQKTVGAATIVMPPLADGRAYLLTSVTLVCFAGTAARCVTLSDNATSKWTACAAASTTTHQTYNPPIAFAAGDPITYGGLGVTATNPIILIATFTIE